MRALTAYVGGEALRFVTILFVSISLVLLIGTILLTYYFSNWWLLLLVPGLVALAIFALVRFVLLRILRTIHRHPFSTVQKKQLASFSSKLTRLAEARATPLPVYAIITLWDIIRHRDARTMRELIDDSRSLRSDFAELEKQFSSR